MFLHVLAEFDGPSISIADSRSLARLFILLDGLPKWVHPELVLVRLARGVISSRRVFQVDVLEVIV